MASLNFIYGTMECGKTTKLVQDAYNYSKHGQKVIIVKPKVDTKGGSKIVSRMSETLECDILLDNDESIFDDVNLKKIVDAKTILVDEAQFLTHDQVFDFWKIAHVMNIHVVSLGTVNRTLIHPREVFVDAIREKATAIILCHNHPSGNSEPSDADLETTKTLVKASKIIGIPILDHIIFNCQGYFSFLEHGLLLSDED